MSDANNTRDPNKMQNQDLEKLLSKRPVQNRYDVGYAKPPAASRFSKGQSGNPKGRPKGAKNAQPALSHEERLKQIILKETYRGVKINDGDKQVTVPMAEAVTRSIAVTAAKGNTRAQRIFTDMVSKTETANRQDQDRVLKNAIEYKAAWVAHVAEGKARGLVPDDNPIPHPDDVIINTHNDTVEFRGPLTHEQHEELLNLLIQKDEVTEKFVAAAIKLRDLNFVDDTGEINDDIKQKGDALMEINADIALRASPKCVARIERQNKLGIYKDMKTAQTDDKVSLKELLAEEEFWVSLRDQVRASANRR